MPPWSGIGMNYGHQQVYNSSQVESDLTFLSSIGIVRVRIALPSYNGSWVNCQDMVTRALAHGMYVVWGISTGAGFGTLNATTWAAYKSAVAGTLVPWAQSVGLSELCIGNECDWQADGTTLTAAIVRSDIRTMVSMIKSGGYTGKVSYNTTILSNIRTPWVSEGIGTLDLIGWNSYDVLTNFQNRNPVIVSAFGNQTYISEFGCITNGYSDYNDESLWYTDVVNRVSLMQSAGVQAGYFFCYRDGGFGLSPNTFALALSTGQSRVARDAVKNVVAPEFSGFCV